MKKILRISLTGLLLVMLTGCSQLSALPQLLSPAESAATSTPAVLEVEVQPVNVEKAVSLDTTVLHTVQETFQEIYNDMNPSVVNIQVTEDFGPSVLSGEGSGFVWDTKGHIVTNNHVVENAATITVVFSDGTNAEAKLVGNDPESDLAVIRVDPASTSLNPATLGDSHTVQVGDLVIAIGNPYGLSGTMTQGIVSALSRSLTVDESASISTSTYTIPDIIQTDAAINPGNSGGVLVNVNGEVIGVTSAIKSSSGSNSGIGFVIPAHIVKRVVPVLIEKGSYDHPRLGISGTTLTASVAESVGMKKTDQQGVLVVNVISGSPADKAGLISSSQQRTSTGMIKLTGGDVITAIEGQTVRTYEDLVSYMFNNTSKGQTITLSILRDGKERSLNLTL